MSSQSQAGLVEDVQAERVPRGPAYCGRVKSRLKGGREGEGRKGERKGEDGMGWDGDDVDSAVNFA